MFSKMTRKIMYYNNLKIACVLILLFTCTLLNNDLAQSSFMSCQILVIKLYFSRITPYEGIVVQVQENYIFQLVIIC